MRYYICFDTYQVLLLLSSLLCNGVFRSPLLGSTSLYRQSVEGTRASALLLRLLERHAFSGWCVNVRVPLLSVVVRWVLLPFFCLSRREFGRHPRGTHFHLFPIPAW